MLSVPLLEKSISPRQISRRVTNHDGKCRCEGQTEDPKRGFFNHEFSVSGNDWMKTIEKEERRVLLTKSVREAMELDRN